MEDFSCSCCTINDFIKVTNQVIEEQLAGKVHLSSVEYSAIDQVYRIKVVCYTLTFVPMSFGFMECAQDLDKDMLKNKFEWFIQDNLKAVENK